MSDTREQYETPDPTELESTRARTYRERQIENARWARAHLPQAPKPPEPRRPDRDDNTDGEPGEVF